MDGVTGLPLALQSFDVHQQTMGRKRWVGVIQDDRDTVTARFIFTNSTAMPIRLKATSSTEEGVEKDVEEAIIQPNESAGFTKVFRRAAGAKICDHTDKVNCGFYKLGDVMLEMNGAKNGMLRICVQQRPSTAEVQARRKAELQAALEKASNEYVTALKQADVCRERVEELKATLEKDKSTLSVGV
jgi:hypothetical protein